MGEETIKVCDVKDCPRRGSKTVLRYKVDLGGQMFLADLCKEHAKPLYDFVGTFPSHYIVKTRPGGRGTSNFRVHSIEEIEAMKRRGKRNS